MENKMEMKRENKGNDFDPRFEECDKLTNWYCVNMRRYFVFILLPEMSECNLENWLDTRCPH